MPDDSSSSSSTSSSTEYLVGTFTTPSGSDYDGFLWQSSQVQIEADTYEAKDENAQTKVLVQTNHRLKISLDAIIKKGHTVPAPGMKVSLSGVTAPTITVTNGQTVVSSGMTYGEGTISDAIVTGTPQITESNTDFIKASFEVTKYLSNEVES